MASQIGQALIRAGFFTEVQKQFPKLTVEQFQGVYLSWNTGVVEGRERVFFRTGIRYRGSLPEAKAIADYCESLVKAALAAHQAAPPRSE
jgi:hypothetical protein